MRSAPKSPFEMRELEPEPESPFLDEADFELPSQVDAWAFHEAESQLQPETPFASALAQAEQETSGLAEEEVIEGEFEPQALEAPAREPEEEPEEKFREATQPNWTEERLELAGEAPPQSQIGPAQVTLRVAELIELWDVATALNERIRHMVVQVLDQQTGTSIVLSPPICSLMSPQAEEELGRKEAQQFINGLIDRGLPENDITNEVFYRRNPKLRGQLLRSGTRQAQQWRSIRDSEVRPAAKRLLGSWIVDPVLLATFFSQYEGDSRVPANATEQFLTRSPLLSMGRTLRDRVRWQWRSGNPPVTLKRLYELAYEVSGHPSSAMLLCHNVTKAFARGGTAIAWNRVSTAPETYSDGKKSWTPKIIHPAGKLTKTYSAKYKRDLPSIYYLLFSETELGTYDPGDWYHYYVAATMTAYGAAGALSPSAPVRELEERKERIGGAIDKAYPLLVRDRLLDLVSQMSNLDLVDARGYRGWVLANVVSFLEGGHYGDPQEDVARESRLHLRGALAGLRTAGIEPGKNWVWYVPGAKVLSKEDLVVGFLLQYKTVEILDANGQRFRPLKKGTK